MGSSQRLELKEIRGEFDLPVVLIGGKQKRKAAALMPYL